MNYHILISFIPFGLILLLSLSLFASLSRHLKDKGFFLLLSIFLATPLLIGLFLYSLFFLFPHHANSFYILAISLPIFLLAFWERKKIFLAPRIIFDKWKILKSQPLDLFLKIILSAILFVLIVVFLRTILWPINWVDQIYYLKQAYVFAQTHSLDLSLRWGVFHDALISAYQMNPAIRPGLPMIFSTTFLFNNSLRDAQFFCQAIIFYYFLLTSAVVFYVSWKIAKTEPLKSGLLALFFMLSTFYFIYLSIEGFKEILTIPIAILLLFYISNQEVLLKKIKPWVFVGILSGLMSFVNYSGTLMALFILAIIAITKGLSFQKVINAAKITLLIIIFSGFEFFVFLDFINPSLFPPLFQKESLSTTKQSFDIVSTKRENDFLTRASCSAKNEFSSYEINSLTDLYIKGKFQGLFQLQYFGLIFILFTIVLIATYRKLTENHFIKNLLLFLLIYGLVFFDPLNINRNEFAYVLSISHKYTALLVPFVAIIIAYQFDWIEKILKKISPRVLIAAIASFYILDLIFFKNNPERLFRIISTFIPILNSPAYYTLKLKALNDLALLLVLILLAILIYLYLSNKKRLSFLFKQTSTILVLFLFLFLFFPFLFFYNSNFGLKNTLRYSFAKDSIKLEKVPGWEGMYSPLRNLNNLPKNKKILSIDQPISLIDIHLTLPMNNIYTLLDCSKSEDISAIKQMGIDYVYAKSASRINNENVTTIADLKLLKRFGENLIFEVKP